jgi:hypothetical protein
MGAGRMNEMINLETRGAFFPPPPCGEGSGVGVVRGGTAVPHGTTPHPDPPPQGGREN